MRSGGWRFCREPSGFDLAYKNGMTSTFATQFISGSPKAMCEHREEKVSCKRLMGNKKGLQRKEKYKRVFRGSIKIDREDKRGIVPACLLREKRNGLKQVVPVQPAKRIGGLLPVPVRNGLP